MARVTDYTLERYVLGELSGDALSALEASLQSDPELRERVEAIRADDARFDPATAGPFAAGLIHRHRAEVRRRWAAGTTLALAAAALLAAGAIALAPPVDPGPSEVREDIRAKGPALRIYKRAGEDVEALRDGAIVLPGATVQLSLSQGGVQGAVFSVDGRGTVTRHFPLDGSRSTALPAGPLPSAFTLDTVPDFERFFLVTSPEPFELEPIAQALEALRGDPRAEPELAQDLEVHATLIRKVNP